MSSDIDIKVGLNVDSSKVDVNLMKIGADARKSLNASLNSIVPSAVKNIALVSAQLSLLGGAAGVAIASVMKLVEVLRSFYDAADFAYRSSLLSSIALGSPLIYETTNPIVCWFLSKGRSTRGGQSVAAMAEFANKTGHFLTSEVGNDNTKVPSNYSSGNESAKQHQSAVVFLPGSGDQLVQNVMQCCRAGLGVALGNSLAVNGVSVKDGIRLATLGGSWAHATSFTAWMRRDGVDYCFWANSHGKRYKGGAFGEPEDGAWMTAALMRRFLDASGGYGRPYAVLAESRSTDKRNLKMGFTVPFPAGW